MKIAITGTEGQLGGALMRKLSPDHTIIPLTIYDFEITDHNNIARLAENRI